MREVAAAEAAAWLRDATRTTYLLDVRTPEEFAAGSLPGAVHAAGGQLIQATDQWVAVRRARVIVFDAEGVRAPVVASWLVQLGYEAVVLAGGLASGLAAPAPAAPALPPLSTITAAELKQALAAGSVRVFDLNGSMAFRKAHIAGSRWSMRTRIAADAGTPGGSIVLVADDAGIAQLAAAELQAAGHRDLHRLEGGLAGWTDAGYPTVATPNDPPDADCVDHLFFVHDRHAGNREAMRQYLAWETGLLAQLDAQDRAEFRVGPALS